MKRIISIIMIALSLFCTTIPVCAADMSADATGVMVPQFVGITFLNVNLTMSAQGCASATGFVRPSSSSYSSYLTLSIQRLTSTGWVTIKSWSGSAAGSSGVNLSGYYYVTSGTYRSCVTAYIYNSSSVLIDNATAYSAQKIY